MSRRLSLVLLSVLAMSGAAVACAHTDDAPAPPVAADSASAANASQSAGPGAVSNADAARGGTAPPTQGPVDINSATREQLMAVKGVGEAYADRIITGRPFRSKDELWRRQIMPKGHYENLKEQIIAKR